jgi:hypothetical protein
MSNVFDPKAHFTLGVRAKKLGANFKHSWIVVWPQVINKCWNIGPKGCKLPSQIQWQLFSALGPIQGHKVQHLFVAWGRLKFIFSISALTPIVRPLIQLLHQ